MFSKTADSTSAPPPARQPGGTNAGRSVLGSDLKITGEITSAGAIEVFGEIEGNITADSVTIGQEGRVVGSIRAGAVEVKGQVDGKIACDSFVMRASAQVTADVTYSTLVIESGAQIGGHFSKPKA